MHISSTQESRGTMETLRCLLAACHRFEFSLVNFLLVKVGSAGALGLVPEKEELTLGIAGVGLSRPLLSCLALLRSGRGVWERVLLAHGCAISLLSCLWFSGSCIALRHNFAPCCTVSRDVELPVP